MVPKAKLRRLNSDRSTTGCSSVSSQMSQAAKADDGDDRQHDDERSSRTSRASLPLSSMICSAPTQTTSSTSPTVSIGSLRVGVSRSRRLRPAQRRGAQPDRHVDQEDPGPGDSCRRSSRPGSARRSAPPAWSSTRCPARARAWRCGKIEISSACEPGIIGPDTAPCSTRNTISAGRLQAMPHRKEATVKQHHGEDEGAHHAVAAHQPAGQRHADAVGHGEAR